MAQLVSLARAARLLGVTRADLQSQIGSGDLTTFEGKIDLDALRDVYPTLDTDRSDAVERARIIKQTAFGRRVQSAVLPVEEDLEQKVRKLQKELDIERLHARRLSKLVDALGKRLVALQQNCSEEQRPVIIGLKGWLREQLDRD